MRLAKGGESRPAEVGQWGKRSREFGFVELEAAPYGGPAVGEQLRDFRAASIFGGSSCLFLQETVACCSRLRRCTCVSRSVLRSEAPA